MSIIEKEYPLFYAAFSRDRDNVERSSSGGIFFELCKYIVQHKGVIYGAVQTEPTEVKHERAETLEEAVSFQRSKYLQSRINDCYARAKKDLEDGRLVLFSGVGCQIDGLKRYLKGEYKNLVTCEVICHGAPMNRVMEKYLVEKESVYEKKVTQIIFRDKRSGWMDNSITEYYADGTSRTYANREHPVHLLYLRGINMERRCVSCKYATLPRIADITLADYWQYEGALREKSANRGLSLVLVNTQIGADIFDGISDGLWSEETPEDMARKSCPFLNHPPEGNVNQDAFLKLLDECGFEKAYEICALFGDVILPDSLQITQLVSAEKVIDIFKKDTQEVIYISDEKGGIQGIVTFGSFILNYGRGKDWVNTDFSYLCLSDINAEKIRSIFGKSDKIIRVPVLDEHGKLLYEIRRTAGANGRSDRRKQLIPLAKLRNRKTPCFFVQRPDFLPGYVYTPEEQDRIEKGLSFSKMQTDIELYSKEFSDVLGQNFSREYVEKLCHISGIVKKGNRYQHADSKSEFVNVIGGQRITVAAPEEYGMSIHIYGRCGVFGYAVEDCQTMPSQLQKLFNEKGMNIRVENHGLWGADEEKFMANMEADIEEGVIQENDIVVIYATFRPWLAKEELEKMSINCYDTTEAFHEFLRKGNTFYDIPGHMTAEGYTFIASYMYKKLGDANVLNCVGDAVHMAREPKKSFGTEHIGAVEDYLSGIKAALPMEKLFQSKNGAIVMNCNPFTRGHRYLIEQAMQSVDYLLLFVLEEDKSFFKYVDRLEMVRQGTKDLSNVFVLPSGNYIISTLTFPEYFLKEQKPDAAIDAADDVQLFGQYIAPALHISVRFVGTEPVDKVTAQYNASLKKYLGLYGVELCEISRLKTGTEWVSASRVRILLKEKQYEELKRYVPDTTYEYLRRMNLPETKEDTCKSVEKLWEDYRHYTAENQNVYYTVEETPIRETGKHKWVGGQVVNDVFYATPNSASTILSYHTKTERIEKIGHFSTEEYKWTGGVVYQGKLYMFPRSANSILILDLKTNQVEEVSLPIQYPGQHHYGGIVTDSGILYQYPIFNTNHILCIDLKCFSCTKIKLFDDKNRYLDYRGGVLHPNGFIYIFPFSEGRVIRLNPQTLEYTFIGDYIAAKCFGAKVAADGNIYGFRRGPGIMKIDVERENCEIIRTDMDSDSCGTMLGINGRIYNVPGRSRYVWEYDIVSGRADKLYELKSNETSKSAGGAISDEGNMYISPTDMNAILRYKACGEHDSIPLSIKNTFFDDCY
ncbi:MAG: adenylyltransferase/cytidyltransferase family protein [Lachnospiraceae bacterium]|nr:adenylyltransferase/cytidyltransferase family protein [Lachnospiraceae bacterium]